MLLQLFSCLLALVVTKNLWRRWKYDLHRIPAPPTIPYFVDLIQVLTRTGKGDLSQLRGRWWKALGCPKLMRMSFSAEPALSVYDITCARTVVMSSKEPFPKTGGLRKNGFIMLVGNDLSVKSLATSIGVDAYVKSVRRVYSTAFQSSNLKLAMPKMHAVIQRMLNIVDAERQQGPVDFQQLCVKMTLDTIGEVAFGCNLGGLDGSSDIQKLIIDVGHIIIDRRMNPLTRIRNCFFPNSEKIRKQNEVIDRLTSEWTTIANDIREREDLPQGEEPIWYGLKNLVDPDTGNRISIESLRAEVGLTVLGGTDTTGHQIAWLLAVLSSHPEAEHKLLDELREHGLMGPRSREVAFADLSELVYLNAVIKEGMRVVHVSPTTFFRSTPRDMTLMGYRIPEGTQITLPGNRWMNSEADWGPDPEAFKPERWLTGEDMSDKYYLGFSFGPRDCIGQRLALTEMKVAIIAILKQFRLSLTIPYESLLKKGRNGLAIEARDGIWFNVLPRVESCEKNGLDAT